MGVIRFRKNALEELWDKAINEDRYFFALSVIKDTDAAYWLERIVTKELFLSYVILSFDDRLFMLAVRTCPDNALSEYKQEYNKQLASSLSKAFGTPVIMGKGKEKLVLYNNTHGKSIELECTGDVYVVFNTVIKQVNNQAACISADNIEVLNSYVAKEADYNTLFAYMKKIRKYEDDCIATEIYTRAMADRKSSRWINKLKKKIENKNALKHICLFRERLADLKDTSPSFASVMHKKNFCDLDII